MELKDQTIIKVKNLLGGYNCGGCGYDNCEGCAKAILSGEAPADMCPMIDQENVEQIEQILAENKK